MNSNFKTFLIKLADSKIYNQIEMLVKINKFLKDNTITLEDLNEAGDIITYEWRTAASPILRDIAEDWAKLLISDVYLEDGTSPFDTKVIKTELANFIKQVAKDNKVDLDSPVAIYLAYEVYEDLKNNIVEILEKFKYSTNNDIMVTGITPDLKVVVADRDLYGYRIEDNIPDVLEDLDAATIEPYI